MGLSSRNTFEEFTLKKIPFITRLRQDNNMEVVSENLIEGSIKTTSLMIYSDHWGYLFKRNGKTKILFRLIKAVKLEDDEPIWFVTNIPELNAEEICSLYKQRWDIENLFKFFKQELNLSHLLNRSENGIKVVLYATLIAAILVIVYKKTNKLKGYKIMKQRFVQDMEKLVAIDLVFLCDGNPEKAKQILFNSS
jgi:transposase